LSDRFLIGDGGDFSDLRGDRGTGCNDLFTDQSGDVLATDTLD